MIDYFETTNINKTFKKHLYTKPEKDEKPEMLQEVEGHSEVWQMEDPSTKGLVDTIDIVLEPGSQYQFIVVLKSPI